MVQFSGFASLILCIQIRIPYRIRWVSPFGHRGIKALLPAPPRFLQAYTSFVAYHRQGIRLMHLFTWLYHLKNLLTSLPRALTTPDNLDSLLWQSLLLVVCPSVPFVFTDKRYNHHPNFCLRFVAQNRFQAAWNSSHCPKPIRNIVFVCWFRLSNLLKIDAFNIAIYFANQNKLNYSSSLWFVKY